MRTAREYLRVSQDRTGLLRSNQEQHADHIARAAREGYALGAPYEDDVSASRYARKTRLGFARLMQDLKTGAFGADELWIWESSRGARNVKEWSDLVDLVDAAGVVIHVATHARTYNPRNPRDRRSLLEDAVDSEYESGKASQRIRRTAASEAAKGRPHGKVPYGYRRTYDTSTGKMAEQVPEPVEAAVIVRLFELLQAGHSLNHIQRTFEAEGIRSRAGVIFRHSHLRGMALSATYAGLRVHAPGSTRWPTKRALPGEGVTFSEATWPALVPRAAYHAVVALLTDPARVTRKPGGARHLLSGIGVCDAAGGALQATSRKSIGPAYQCPCGHIAIAYGPLEEIVTAVILGYLSRPDVRQRLVAASQESPQLAVVRDALADARARLNAAYASAATAGGISPAALAAVEAHINAEIEKLERQQLALAPVGVLAQFISPGAEVHARWEASPIQVRREVARLLMTPQHVGQLRILRRPADWPNFTAVPVELRVRWRREDGDV